MAAAREAPGDDPTRLVDANGCYTPDKAIEVGRFLEDNGVRHFEEPCPYWELDWTAAVADALDLEVAGGEQDCMPNLSMVTVFALHLMGAIPNGGPYVEYSIEPSDYYPWQVGLFEPALTVRDGAVAIPDGPGWGVQPSPEWLERANRQVTRI